LERKRWMGIHRRYSPPKEKGKKVWDDERNRIENEKDERRNDPGKVGGKVFSRGRGPVPMNPRRQETREEPEKGWKKKKKPTKNTAIS